MSARFEDRHARKTVTGLTAADFTDSADPGLPAPQGLYDPALDKDSCGVGFIADIKGQKTHQIVSDALQILCNLEHRGATGADPRMGDGAGILVQMPHKFFARKAKELGFTLPEPGQYGVGHLFLPRDKALVSSGSLAVLRGNLAPNGAVIKPAAAEAHLLKHVGAAIVFSDYNDMAARIDDPGLPVTRDSVIVLKHAGPLGAPGMPEWGQLPIPKKLLAEGVRDMVRISDARMSGTSYGACVLHVSPESFIGGPLALVQDGDLIELDVPARKIELKVPADELARRRAAWKQPPPRYERGFGALYQQHVTQADAGCDFDFLEAAAPTAEPEIH